MQKVNRIKNALSKNDHAVNALVMAVGVILMCLSYIPVVKEYPDLASILMNIGVSLLSAGIVTLITMRYMIRENARMETVDQWGLEDIFTQKNQMNVSSNKYLTTAEKRIDIIATGMTSYRRYQGKELEQCLEKGVEIRILSCNNPDMLRQREKDESLDHKESNTMMQEVKSLSEWVASHKTQKGNIEIKYHSTYPGFAYLRIDNHIFVGPNLPGYTSQQCMAFEFSDDGDGGKYFSDYFEKIWNDKNFSSSEI